MANYRVFIAAEVIAFLKTCRRTEQLAVTRLFDSLARDPQRVGEFVEHDEIGRPIQGVIVGRYALLYWADHAVRELKVVDMKPADR